MGTTINIKALRNSISQLQFFPYKFPLVQDDILQNQSVRCIPYRNYYVFYQIIEQTHTVIIYNSKHTPFRINTILSAHLTIDLNLAKCWERGWGIGFNQVA